MSEPARIWRCGTYRLDLARPLIMGIINVTPDSFSDGGEREDPFEAVVWGEELVAQGADIIDIGGESTRPGAEAVTEMAERTRVRPVVTRLAGEGVPLSIDSRHAHVAASCVEAGASIINDISGFSDAAMVDLAAATDAGVVIMHMQGEPRTMQREPHYDDVVAEVSGYLLGQATALEAAGVARERIAVDPGIGFGKSTEHNLALLRAIPELVEMGYPVLVGASRKRFIGDLTGEAKPRERLGGSVGVAVEAVRLGAHIVRVHDVKATRQALTMAAAVRG